MSGGKGWDKVSGVRFFIFQKRFREFRALP